MGFKEKLQEKIEKNSVKSTLSWTDKSGNFHTEDVLLKRSRIPLVGDWGRIYPPINENGSMNWMNFLFGGYKNLVKLLLFGAIIAMVLFAFSEIFHSIELFKSQPCVQGCIELAKQQVTNLPNLPNFG